MDIGILCHLLCYNGKACEVFASRTLTLNGGNDLKVDLSCPVELRGYELAADDAGNTRANIQLYNLDTHRISAFEAVAYWKDARSGLSAAAPFAVDHLRAEPGSCFSVAMSSGAFAHPDRVELNFSRVRFEDGSREWRCGSGTIVEVPEPTPLSDAEKRALIVAAGTDAVRFASEDKELWRCVCGRDNPAERAACARCGRKRGEVLARFTQEALQRSRAAEPRHGDATAAPPSVKAAPAAQKAPLPRRLLSALLGLTAAAFLAAMLLFL